MKLLRYFLLTILIISLVPIHALATASTTEDIIRFDDGSYILISVVSLETRATSTRTGSKTYKHINALGAELWNATLTGTFTYDGTTSICTNSSVSVNIVNSAWYIVSSESGKIGNSATGELTMGRKTLGITTTKETINMSLTCDANGNLS